MTDGYRVRQGQYVARLPLLNLQPIDFMKMFIPCGHYELMSHGNRRNPDIVFRDRASLFAQSVLYFAIVLSARDVAWQYRSACGKCIDAGQILRNTRGLSRAIIKLTEHDLGTNTSRAALRRCRTAASFAKSAITLLVSSRYLPVCAMDLLAPLCNRLGHDRQIALIDRARKG